MRQAAGKFPHFLGWFTSYKMFSVLFALGKCGFLSIACSCVLTLKQHKKRSYLYEYGCLWTMHCYVLLLSMSFHNVRYLGTIIINAELKLAGGNLTEGFSSTQYVFQNTSNKPWFSYANTAYMLSMPWMTLSCITEKVKRIHGRNSLLLTLHMRILEVLQQQDIRQSSVSSSFPQGLLPIPPVNIPAQTQAADPALLCGHPRTALQGMYPRGPLAPCQLNCVVVYCGALWLSSVSFWVTW